MFVEGSALSVDVNRVPFVWNIMIESLLHQLTAECKICACADNPHIMVKGNSCFDLEQLSSAINGRTTRRLISHVGFVRNNLDFSLNLSLGYVLTGHGLLNYSCT